ncbi:MAG: aspartate aminotransferase family protein [Pseudohongiellaceae bacterium]
MSSEMTTIELEERFGVPFCRRQPLAFVRGHGSRVWDEAGKAYLDFTSGWGVTSLGHCHPALQAALAAQAGQLTQNPNSGFTYSPIRAQLLARLAPLLPAPLSRLYFVNSGAEANDVAIKMARKLTGRSRVVTTLGAFHGRTLNTLAVSGSAAAAASTGHCLPTTCLFPTVTLTSCARRSMPVPRQSSSSRFRERVVCDTPDDYLAAISGLCRQHGALLIVDEIQTGMGRTGSLFASEQCRGDVHADMMTLGKGLASGFPFAALAMSEGCAEQVEPGDHGGTYCGNPLACAVALAVLETLQAERAIDNVVARGQQLSVALPTLQAKYPDIIRQVRGRGLLWALQLDEHQVQPLTEACQQQGLLVTPTRGGVIRLLPALLVNESEIDAAMTKLAAALLSVRTGEYTLDCCAQGAAAEPG